jgi:hypothetical protein
VTLDQPAHHLGLARRTEGGARFLRALDFDQPIDDLAALDQAGVQLGVDAVDLGAQIRKRRAGRGVNLRRSDFDIGMGGAFRGTVITRGAANAKKTLTE